MEAILGIYGSVLCRTLCGLRHGLWHGTYVIAMFTEPQGAIFHSHTLLRWELNVIVIKSSLSGALHTSSI